MTDNSKIVYLLPSVDGAAKLRLECVVNRDGDVQSQNFYIYTGKLLEDRPFATLRLDRNEAFTWAGDLSTNFKSYFFEEPIYSSDDDEFFHLSDKVPAIMKAHRLLVSLTVFQSVSHVWEFNSFNANVGEVIRTCGWQGQIDERKRLDAEKKEQAQIRDANRREAEENDAICGDRPFDQSPNECLAKAAEEAGPKPSKQIKTGGECPSIETGSFSIRPSPAGHYWRFCTHASPPVCFPKQTTDTCFQ